MSKILHQLKGPLGNPHYLILLSVDTGTAKRWNIDFSSPHRALRKVNVKLGGRRGVERHPAVHDFAHQLSAEFRGGVAEGKLPTFTIAGLEYSTGTDQL